tara:strand:+ start:800 stop:1303 length:504 start_codon:yes stop_codon:yes gene_type:complete
MKMKKIDKINDNHILNYLKSRNENFNRSKMINSNKIEFINHFIWWFTNKREIFYYKINKAQIIYFWHEIIKFKNTKFVIGGWHSNSRKINLIYVLYALKWQLKYNKKNNIKYDWIAVVKKNNKWILKLTKYLGYESVKNNSIHYKAIKKNFKVRRKDFYFLKLKTKL